MKYVINIPNGDNCTGCPCLASYNTRRVWCTLTGNTVRRSGADIRKDVNCPSRLHPSIPGVTREVTIDDCIALLEEIRERHTGNVPDIFKVGSIDKVKPE